MSRSRYLVASLLLALAVAASAAAAASPYEARQQDKRTIPSDASHIDEETARLLAAEGATLAAIWAAKKDMQAQLQPLEAKPSGGVATLGDDQSSSGGGVATQGDDQSSSEGSGTSSGSGEHGKEEGSNKEGEKQGKSCLTKEECHKKKMLCGKGCTLSAHSKCAAKCTKSCVPTC
ncbi:hypothetical protein SEVIR_3G016400v4 [Setaria viridis]|uniref:Uncharacterized protein n=2 Tax=Setaria TaxID=4554 RepID=K3ZFD4_SETIT|nr:uncharacterized protein LOC101767545 [Setaria italica]XP_034584337.1 uncharacterized protein LOC117847266 [Setaria viridis]RCV14898.1 hypothetical protein SETIT_3G015400v2 [Setaria italica]TKW23887.1 hypothetical protein SEVIR_3G016400v2 [Setaria viridis]